MLFWIFGGLFLLYALVSGWRRGIVRQSLSICAIAAGYFAGIFGGRLLLPILRGVGYPDLAISVLAGCILGLLVTGGISALGAILFKKTCQQDVFLVRWGYGLGGALLSAGFGVFLLWFSLIALRLLGTVAETEIKIATKGTQGTKGGYHGDRQSGSDDRQSGSDPGAFVRGVADLKHAVEHGPIGELAERADPLPGRIYSIMGNTTRVISNPAAIKRFSDFPGIQKLSDNPRVRSLLDDPEIARAARDRNYLQLMKNKRLVEALNDPEVMKMVKEIELEKALDFALKEGQAPAEPTRSSHPSRSSH